MVYATLDPSLAFLDIGMPGLDGCGAATCLRQAQAAVNNGSLKIVRPTARDSAADRALTAAVRFDLHVQKPTESDQHCGLARQNMQLGAEAIYVGVIRAACRDRGNRGLSTASDESPTPRWQPPPRR